MSPDRFETSVSVVIKCLRLLILKGYPHLKDERQNLLNEFVGIMDEFEATDPEGKTKEQCQEIMKRMPDIKRRAEASIQKIRNYVSSHKQELNNIET